MPPPRARTRAISARWRLSAPADPAACGLLRALTCTAGPTSGRGTTARIAGDTAAAITAVSDVAAARHCRSRRLREVARAAKSLLLWRLRACEPVWCARRLRGGSQRAGAGRAVGGDRPGASQYLSAPLMAALMCVSARCATMYTFLV